MDYKATLNLPKTDFPMKANLPVREPELLAWWEREGLYEDLQRQREGSPLYVLHDGPPYANGHIHIGHALNKILKDFIVKAKSMEGYRTPYIPGWDCHGLPIEHQVTKQLRDRKTQLSAVELRNRCREYAEKYYHIQREEFQRLGVFADWRHPYLTMEKQYEETIVREFGKFVEKGVVYKGLKPVLWCTVDQTALAEAEVEYADHSSPSIYVRFPLEEDPKVLAGSERLNVPSLADVSRVSVVIWTTTPWTLPANQAIAMHPDIEYAFVRVGDEALIMADRLVHTVAKECGVATFSILDRKKGKDGFEGLVGRRPLSKGHSPVLLAEFVTLDQGTGCVHIAPGHGMEDFLLVLEYRKDPRFADLEVVVPVDGQGRFTSDIEAFAGQHVLKANSGIIQTLESQRLLVGQQTVRHSYPHCWRCKNPVIFRATQQCFVSMDKTRLRAQALEEVDRVRWIPPRGRDRIHGMISNRPDWCLSRQRTWGTPIPTFTCRQCETTLMDSRIISHVASLVADHGADVWFERSAAELLPSGTACPSCGGGEFEKDQDILDVWFESGVSHAAVLKAHGPEWWPADLYLEGSDQHRGWFHSALLASVTTDGRAPYKTVLTHGFVVDGEGKKMSKSEGNVVTPQEVIQQSGAEILRLWVAYQDYQEDLRISKAILKQLIEAYRKIRNTCRFLLSNLYDFDQSVHRVPYDELPELDRWALARLGRLIGTVRQAYQEFAFHQIMHEVEYFCSVDMSATYFDILKDRLYTFPQQSPLRRGSQTVLREIVVALAKLLAPILSFTAEEIWRSLPAGSREEVRSIHLTAFPDINSQWPDDRLVERWEYLLGVRGVVLGALEAARRDKLIGSSLEAKVILTVRSEHFPMLKGYEPDLSALFIVSQVEVQPLAHGEPKAGGEEGEELGVTAQIVKAEGRKCERCWNYREAVGSDPSHPSLCDRCLEAVR